MCDVGSPSVLLSSLDVSDSLKLGPEILNWGPGQDMSYHDNDLPSLRNINIHLGVKFQTLKVNQRKYVEETIEISIGPTEHGFFRRLRVTNDNPFIFLLKPDIRQSH